MTDPFYSPSMEENPDYYDLDSHLEEQYEDRNGSPVEDELDHRDYDDVLDASRWDDDPNPFHGDY